ncbi:MAG: septum formation protein Maf [Bdellovibrionales bacterium]|nr:septum formation protein Maf [Bdellovibrionales bacterium]
MKSLNYPIVLASASPRRVELLKGMGLEFYVRKPDVDETVLPREKPLAMVKRLSESKASTVVQELLREVGMGLVIAADTTVVSPKGEILGKPANSDESFRMVSALSGKVHKVLTGYTIILGAREMKPKIWSRVVTTSVKFRKLSKQQIQQYVDTGEGLDKAGAYAIQGRGSSLILSITGSYTNVVGLPIAELAEDLRAKFGLTDGII